jgi:hypothetical protein
MDGATCWRPSAAPDKVIELTGVSLRAPAP